MTCNQFTSQRSRRWKTRSFSPNLSPEVAFGDYLLGMKTEHQGINLLLFFGIAFGDHNQIIL